MESWRKKAACQGEDTSLFFAPDCDTQSQELEWEKVLEGRKICMGKCRVRKECLAYALEFGDGREELQGIWGGRTTLERREMLLRGDGG